MDKRSLSTAKRIIDAAERLFGTYGIEAVPMRQIILEARVSNNSAIAYHFGDRYDLVRAIWGDRLPRLEQVRQAMLEEAIAAGLGGDPQTLAKILVLPAYQLQDEHGRHPYAAFLRQSLRWEPARELRRAAMHLSPSSAKCYDLFRKQFDHLPLPLFQWRTRAATSLFFDLVYDRDCDMTAGVACMAENDFLKEAFQMMVQIVDGPQPVERASS